MTDPRQRAVLSKELGLRQYFALGFGTIIGVGWVIVLGEWLSQAGPLGTVLAFLVGGFVMMLVGLCYAELAVWLPASGGEVAYTYEIYGVKTSFVAGWLLALVYVATTAYEALSVGWIAAIVFPSIEGPVLYISRGEPVHLGSLLLGIVGMLMLTFLNYRGVKNAARFQDVVTWALVAISALFIGVGLIWGEVSNLDPLFGGSGSGFLGAGFLAVLVTTPFWFAGFNVIPQLMEEKAPNVALRSVGKVILISIGVAGVFYCLVVLSSSMVTPWTGLLELEMPAAAAFESAFGSPVLARVVLLGAFLGVLSTWNAVFLAATRLIFALGRAHIISPVFGKLHPVFGSPTTAILLVSAVGCSAVFLGRQAIIPVVNVSGTCLALVFFLSCWGVLRVQRNRRQSLSSKLRVPGGKVTASVAALACLFMFLVSLYQPYLSEETLPLEWLFLLVWSFLGLIFWILARKIRAGVEESERRQLIMGTTKE